MNIHNQEHGPSVKCQIQRMIVSVVNLELAGIKFLGASLSVVRGIPCRPQQNKGPPRITRATSDPRAGVYACAVCFYISTV